MPFHWCMDETLMVLSVLPFIGAFFLRVKTWWHVKFSHSKKECHSDHHPCVPRKWKITGRVTGKDYGIFEAVSTQSALDELARSMIGEDKVKEILSRGGKTLSTKTFLVIPYN